MAGYNEIQAPGGYATSPLADGVQSLLGKGAAQLEPDTQHSGFAQALGSAVHNFGSVQKGAQAAMQHVARGTDGEVHDSMMATEKANTTFKFGFTCLKKAIECYKEVTQRMG